MFQQEYQFWTSSWVALIVITEEEKKRTDFHVNGLECKLSELTFLFVTMFLFL